MICKHILYIASLNEPELFLHTVKWFQVLLCISNNLIKSFVYTQLNDTTVLFQTIQFSKSHLLTHNLNVNQFYLPHWCYNSGLEWTREQWQLFLKAQRLEPHYQIVLCLIVSLGVGILPICGDAVGVFYSPSWLGWL